MKQYKSSIQNNNNNNNNNNKRDKNEIYPNEGGEASGGEREGRYFYFIFSSLVSFSDLRKSDRRFLSGLKAKLIYAMRATRGHPKVGISTNSVR